MSMILEASDAPCERAKFSSESVSACEPQYAAMTGVPEINANVATTAESAIEKGRGKVMDQSPPQSKHIGVLRYLREPPYAGRVRWSAYVSLLGIWPRRMDHAHYN
jgi:hypothetical protein